MGNLRGKTHFTLSSFINIVLLFIFLIQTSFVGSGLPQAFAADPSPSPSPTDVSLSEFDDICKETLSAAKESKDQPSTTGTAPDPKLQYCKSAKSAIHAKDTNGVLWKVWAAVGGVCAAACAASFAGIGNQYICMGISAAAGVTDAVVTKQFINAMIALGGVGGAFMINQMNAPQKPTLTEEEIAAGKKAETPKQKDIGACILTGVAAYQVYSRYNGMKSSERSAEQNLISAKNQNNGTGSAATADAGSNTISAGGVGGSTTSATTSTSGTTSSGGSESASSATSTTCSAAQSSRNVGLMVQCAVASDSTLPKYLGTQRFADDFKKASGTDLGDFFAKNDSPGRTMASAMSGTLTSDQSMKLAAALQEMGQKMPNETTGFVYRSGGGGNSGGGGSGDPSLEAMMNGIMQQFMPQDGKEKEQNNGLSQVIFANKNHSPTAVAENKTLSIFDRITFRYYYVGQRLLTEDLK